MQNNGLILKEIRRLADRLIGTTEKGMGGCDDEDEFFFLTMVRDYALQIRTRTLAETERRRAGGNESFRGATGRKGIGQRGNET